MQWGAPRVHGRGLQGHVQAQGADRPMGGGAGGPDHQCVPPRGGAGVAKSFIQPRGHRWKPEVANSDRDKASGAGDADPAVRVGGFQHQEWEVQVGWRLWGPKGASVTHGAAGGGSCRTLPGLPGVMAESCRCPWGVETQPWAPTGLSRGLQTSVGWRSPALGSWGSGRGLQRSIGCGDPSLGSWGFRQGAAHSSSPGGVW